MISILRWFACMGGCHLLGCLGLGAASPTVQPHAGGDQVRALAVPAAFMLGIFLLTVSPPSGQGAALRPVVSSRCGLIPCSGPGALVFGVKLWKNTSKTSSPDDRAASRSSRQVSGGFGQVKSRRQKSR